ncbi:hypothetical protein HFO49_26125 [Rhizobium leguminosarum]|uniref:hypothetical protein n=1 Tax=Rhizobium leguminosarum TaxID=384 RepID=UPI001C98746C|nr:hypothetical protein [Rhizobium leguminosarum]MBY5590922.1 hypothetical protein [Rhizobium leguminosarum]
MSIFEVSNLSHLGKATSPEIIRPDFVKPDAWTFLLPLAEWAWTMVAQPVFQNAFQVEAFLCSVVVRAPGFENYGFTNQEACRQFSLHLKNLRNYIAMDRGTKFHEAMRCYSVALGSQSPLPRSKGFQHYYRARAEQFERWKTRHLDKLAATGHPVRETTVSAPAEVDGRAIFTMSADDLEDQIDNLTNKYLRVSCTYANLIGVPPEALLWRSSLRFYDETEAKDDLFCLQALAEYQAAWEGLSRPPTKSHADVESLLATILVQKIVEWDRVGVRADTRKLIKQYVVVRAFATFLPTASAISGFGRNLSHLTETDEIVWEQNALDWALGKLALDHNHAPLRIHRHDSETADVRWELAARMRYLRTTPRS